MYVKKNNDAFSSLTNILSTNNAYARSFSLFIYLSKLRVFFLGVILELEQNLTEQQFFEFF